MGGRVGIGLEARVEVFSGLEGQAAVLQQRLEVGDAGLEVPDVAARWSVAEPRLHVHIPVLLLTCAVSRAL